MKTINYWVLATVRWLFRLGQVATVYLSSGQTIRIRLQRGEQVDFRVGNNCGYKFHATNGRYAIIPEQIVAVKIR
jgi:hypothetical protein